MQFIFIRGIDFCKTYITFTQHLTATGNKPHTKPDKKMSEYEKKAMEFLQATGTTFKAEFAEYGKHFTDDKEERDIYEITLTKDGRKFVFKFGQSIAKSGQWIVKDFNLTRVFNDKNKAFEYAGKIGNRFNVKTNPERKAPTAYDVLACLTKADPGDYDNFCSEYGYDKDSRKAFKTYKAVRKEWKNVERLFTDEQIQQLQEIN